jgi:hypothetical protein
VHRQSAAASLAAALLLLAGHGSQLPALSYFPAAQAWQGGKIQSVAFSLRAGELFPSTQGVHDNCLGVTVTPLDHCVATSQIMHAAASPLAYRQGLVDRRKSIAQELLEMTQL